MQILNFVRDLYTKMFWGLNCLYLSLFMLSSMINVTSFIVTLPREHHATLTRNEDFMDIKSGSKQSTQVSMELAFPLFLVIDLYTTPGSKEGKKERRDRFFIQHSLSKFYNA